MSALLLAMLQDGGYALAGEALLGSLRTGEASLQVQAELSVTFRNLLLGSASISLLGLAAALALPNRELRGP